MTSCHGQPLAPDYGLAGQAVVMIREDVAFENRGCSEGPDSAPMVFGDNGWWPCKVKVAVAGQRRGDRVHTTTVPTVPPRGRES